MQAAAAAARRGSGSRQTWTSLDFDWKWNAHWIAHTIEAPQFMEFHSQRLSWAAKKLLLLLLEPFPGKGKYGGIVRSGGQWLFSFSGWHSHRRKQLGDWEPELMWTFLVEGRNAEKSRPWCLERNSLLLGGKHSKVSPSSVTFSSASHPLGVISRSAIWCSLYRDGA